MSFITNFTNASNIQFERTESYDSVNDTFPNKYSCFRSNLMLENKQSSSLENIDQEDIFDIDEQNEVIIEKISQVNYEIM